MWQMAMLGEKGANAVFKSWKLHSWYIDPNTVIFCLANGNKAVPDEVKEAMAKKLHSLDRPTGSVMLKLIQPCWRKMKLS